mgnify:CR=1 FL=1|jgi:hypothetical protein
MSPEQEDSSVELIREVDAQLRNVHTQSLDISFNELADMIDQGELDISPDYQRLFQWSEGARSRFIESLLLEMPVPPIYVVEEDDNKKLLIDGLQRISSYLHFRGMLSAPHLSAPVSMGDFLVLQDCDIVKSLNGKTYNDLATALKIKLRRAFVRVEVIRKGSDPKFKYYMFKRLNSGGQALTDQQLRNCTIRLLDSRFNDFIIRLSQKESYRICISTVSDEQILGGYDQELVLRFFALRNWLDKFTHDVSDFLTDYMEQVSDPESSLSFNYEAEEEAFDRTFNILSKTLGDESFSRANKSRDRLIKGFGVYHFESFCVGLQPYLGQLTTEVETNPSRISEIFKEIKLNQSFIDLTTGGGKNSPGPLRARIEFVKSQVAAKL